LVTDVGSPNVSKSITADELAQGSQFSGRYKPLASDSIFIPATQFFGSVGSPTLLTVGNASTGANRVVAWLFDAASNETISTTTIIPPGWASLSVHLWWSNAGAGAGDVVWYFYHDLFADGDDTDTNTLVTASAVAAPLQYVAKRQAFSGTVSVTAGQLLKTAIFRFASDATDTLANDAAVIGLELVRAS
jgi:hypothetical protein